MSAAVVPMLAVVGRVSGKQDLSFNSSKSKHIKSKSRLGYGSAVEPSVADNQKVEYINETRNK